MGIKHLILKAAAPLPQVEAFDRYLFVGPHPDDIEIGAGATAAKLVQQGKKVTFLICTDGRFGDGNFPAGTDRETVIETRRQEAIASAACLGVTDVRFLGFCDGGFYDISELERALAVVIGEVSPQLVLAPDPDVISECHADHLNVGRTIKKLAEFAPYPGIMEQYGAKAAPVEGIALYMTDKANRFVKTGEYLKKQLKAVFDCHLSQFPKDSGGAKSVQLYLQIRSADFGIRTLSSGAEGFRVLGQTHMHCFPEAGK